MRMDELEKLQVNEKSLVIFEISILKKTFVTTINNTRFWESSCLRFSTLCKVSPDLV